jgi:hypothetical protein
VRWLRDGRPPIWPGRLSSMATLGHAREL